MSPSFPPRMHEVPSNRRGKLFPGPRSRPASPLGWPPHPCNVRDTSAKSNDLKKVMATFSFWQKFGWLLFFVYLKSF